MVEVGTGTAGSRFLKKSWPITEGLIAGTTKAKRTNFRLEPTEDSNVESSARGEKL